MLSYYGLTRVRLLIKLTYLKWLYEVSVRSKSLKCRILLFEQLRQFFPSDVGCFATYLLDYIRIDQNNAFVWSAVDHSHTPRQRVELHTGAAPPSPQVHNLCRIFFRRPNPLSIIVRTLHTSRHVAISASNLYIDTAPVGRTAKVHPGNDHYI